MTSYNHYEKLLRYKPDIPPPFTVHQISNIPAVEDTKSAPNIWSLCIGWKYSTKWLSLTINWPLPSLIHTLATLVFLRPVAYARPNLSKLSKLTYSAPSYIWIWERLKKYICERLSHSLVDHLNLRCVVWMWRKITVS